MPRSVPFALLLALARLAAGGDPSLIVRQVRGLLARQQGVPW